ncbi:unnamed protein product [Strongylus vulgaris]|uniref:Zinc finger PHD-type domain-containing protein n=1 Tax=Strongylus vulgaris TaxID=40348 RepID=A0A3P7KCQ6_STRVU|nr:unnamed protein product [Strongylus vulgaris]
MVACDNKAVRFVSMLQVVCIDFPFFQCPYQWFHYPCVNITSTPKGRWYCPHCTEERKRIEGVDLSTGTVPATAVL